MLVLDLPILREVELVLDWTVHNMFKYAQFPLLENQFVSSTQKYYFRQALCVHVSGSRVLSCLLLSSVSLCLRVMLCVRRCVVLCTWCVSMWLWLWLWSWSVCVCGVVWHAENLPCVASKRPRVCRHHAHMLKHMCAWCRYTRGRFERTHMNSK